jgi:very-short-patch-repair endonuclease
MDPSDVPFEAVNQRGTFTRQQAYDEGWTARQVRRRLDAGRWSAITRSVLCDSDTEVGPWQLGWAVVLTWPEAVISHELAGALHGFPVPLAAVGTATVPLDRSRRAHGLRGRRLPLDLKDVGTLGGLPVTTERRTALDLLRTLPWGEARSLWSWLVTRQRLALDDVRAEVDSATGRAGTGQLRRLIDASRTGSLSAAEDRLHILLTRAGITGWRANVSVVVNGRVVGVVDVLFEDARVVIEVDGYRSHSGRDAFQRDRSRQNDLVGAGYTVLRFTWDDLERRPAQVLRRIAAALQRQG